MRFRRRDCTPLELVIIVGAMIMTAAIIAYLLW